MIPKFKRPTNIPYPNVWYRFQLKDTNSDELVHYKIQDLTPNRYEDAVKHLVKYFLPDETICESRNLSNDPDSIADFRDIVRSAIMNHKLTVACFREGSDEIIGINVLLVKQRDDIGDWNHVCTVYTKINFPKTFLTTFSKYNSSKVRDIETTHLYVSGQFDVFRHYKTRRCLTGFALSVLPWYREMGIGQKILEAKYFPYFKFFFS